MKHGIQHGIEENQFYEIQLYVLSFKSFKSLKLCIYFEPNLMQRYILCEVATALLCLCTMPCNVKPEKCATTKFSTAPEFLWSHNYFIFSRGVFMARS
jgi:hypothetical protein